MNYKLSVIIHGTESRRPWFSKKTYNLSEVIHIKRLIRYLKEINRRSNDSETEILTYMINLLDKGLISEFADFIISGKNAIYFEGEWLELIIL